MAEHRPLSILLAKLPPSPNPPSSFPCLHLSQYKKAKSGKNKLPPSGTAAVGAIERNKKMAGRAGQSSLTLEEEARVKLLLGPDTEGDDPAGEMFAPNGGADDSVEHETKGDLFTNVFGGLGEKSRLSPGGGSLEGEGQGEGREGEGKNARRRSERGQGKGDGGGGSGWSGGGGHKAHG